MKYSQLGSNLRVNVLKMFIRITILTTGFFVQAQDGTYELKNKNGSYSYISLIKKQNYITAEIFAWWNTTTAQTGSYYGTGIWADRQSVLKSDENDPDCTVRLKLINNVLHAKFEKCAPDHLTEDFNGMYTKISDATAGDYKVTSEKSFLYSEPAEKYKQSVYLIKGDTVTLNLDRITKGNWIYIYFKSANGKETSGYIKLGDVRKI